MIAPRTISRRQFLAATAGAAMVALASRSLGNLPASATVDIYVVTSGPLRLRSGPGLTSSILAELPVGTRMEIIDTGAVADGYTWVKVWVSSLDKTGYVAREFIAKETTAPVSGTFPIGSTVHVDSSTGGNVNLRSGAGLSFSVVKIIPNGTTGTILSGETSADGYDWVKVSMLGVTGWMAARCLDAGTGTTTPPPVTPSTGVFPIGSTVHVDSSAGGDVNLRAGPGLSFAVTKFIPNGTSGTVLSGETAADGYSWVQVSMLGATGWMVARCLEAGTGTVTPPPVTPAFAVGTRVVTTSDLNLRAAAGTTAVILAVLPKGTALTVTGAPAAAAGYTWYPVKTDGGSSGWVAGTYLAASSSPVTPGFPQGSTVKVATDSLNLRSAASLTATVLLVLPFGTSLTVTGAPTAANGYTWYPVKTAGGTAGWVAGEYLA
jgi:uncharacterized protein YgiM (DUF1202 family)